MSHVFRLKSHIYQLVPGTLTLKKTGQLSLFDEQLHPRDHGKFTTKDKASSSEKEGGKTEDGESHPVVTKYISQHSEKISGAFQRVCDKFLSQIASMSLQKLHDLDADGHVNDEILIPQQEAVEQSLSNQGLDAQSLQDFSLYDSVEGVRGIYDATVEKAESLISQQITKREHAVVSQYIQKQSPRFLEQAKTQIEQMRQLLNSMPINELDEIDPHELVADKLLDPVMSKVQDKSDAKGFSVDVDAEMLYEQMPEYEDLINQTAVEMEAIIEERLGN